MWVVRAVLLCGMLALAQARDEGRVVSTAQGAVRGYPSELGDYFAFYGIPYATAPTGADKFKEPLPPPIWNEIFEATDETITCPQPSLGPVPLFAGVQREDCLVINVFVPKSASKEKNSLPVMAYVHGGGFAVGNGNMATHERLIRHEVIVVNFNYRVGTYGFLCLGTKDIPGNAGLKDQVAALRWVKRNIANFGGNPDDVTIGGYSAGSVSVELLMVSPMARGLFNKAISESGSVLSPWAVDPDPIAMAKRFVKDVSDKSFDDVRDLEGFLKSLTMEQLISKIYMTEKDSNLGFTPCVEQRIEEQENFLVESPLEILKSGKYNKVPYLTGFASEEGLFRIELFDAWKDDMEENFSNFLPQDLTFNSDDERKSVAEKVKWFYFKEQPVSVDTIKQFVDYFTDVMFGYPTIRAARLHVTNSAPLYLYEYSYVSGEYPPQAHSDKIKGAYHCAQIQSLHSFTYFMKRVNVSDMDVLMEDRLTKMWTDFSKYGIPVRSTSALLPVEWDTMDADAINYLSMDVQLQKKKRLLGDRVEFWDSIYGEYYRTPLPPHTTPVHTEL